MQGEETPGPASPGRQASTNVREQPLTQSPSLNGILEAMHHPGAQSPSPPRRSPTAHPASHLVNEIQCS